MSRTRIVYRYCTGKLFKEHWWRLCAVATVGALLCILVGLCPGGQIEAITGLISALGTAIGSILD